MKKYNPISVSDGQKLLDSSEVEERALIIKQIKELRDRLHTVENKVGIEYREEHD